MSSSEIEKIVCWQCQAVLDLGDHYCRHCGAPTSRPATPRDSGATLAPRAGESRLVILLMLFVVLGPLALPMLWRCRCFSTVWKLILTALVLGATLAIVWFAWFAFQAVLVPLREVLGPRLGSV